MIVRLSVIILSVNVLTVAAPVIGEGDALVGGMQKLFLGRVFGTFGRNLGGCRKQMGTHGELKTRHNFSLWADVIKLFTSVISGFS